MTSTETLEMPTQTDTKIPEQRSSEDLPDGIVYQESPRLPEPGIGDFDLERGRARLNKVARLSGYLVVGPRIHITRR